MTALALPVRTGARHHEGLSALKVGAWLAAALAILPLLSVVWLALTRPASAALPLESIIRYAANTALLGGVTAMIVTILGTTAAWLVVMCQIGRAHV